MKDIFLIDMDDTLLDFPKAERANLTQTLARFGFEIGESHVARFHAINDGLWKALERGETTRERLKVQRFELFFEAYGLQGDAPAVAQAYWENFPFVCFPFDGAAEFLKELKSRGRVYIVTNGGTLIQKRHLRDAGFEPFIERVFISEEIGFDKPSLEFADFVEANIPDYARERAVWVGDSLTSDGKCAASRGIDFILFTPRGAVSDYAGKSASSYGEVLNLI